MLPRPAGLPVGVRDFAWRDKGDGPIDGSNHVVGRLFYPADPQSARRRWPAAAPSWIGSLGYAAGYVQFAFFSARTLKLRVIKRVLQAVIWVQGTLARLPVTLGAPLARPGGADAADTANGNGRSGGGNSSSSGGGAAGRWPVVIFSPGAAANRNTYSCICTELASRGCFVAAIEHADGSSGAARLADGSFLLFQGLGSGAVLEAKGEYRAAEVAAAVELLRGINAAGAAPEGSFSLSGGDQDAALAELKGALDLSRLAVIGHSCGGATAALAAARCPDVAVAVALDPWWPILPTGSPALTGWLPGCRAPLLVVGSDDWNTPRADGSMPCDAKRQAAVLEAARRRDGPEGGAGGGALLLVPSHSKHQTFSDVPVLIERSALARGVLSVMGFKQQQPMSAEAALRLICDCCARFCREHYRPGGSEWPCEGAGGDAAGEAAAVAVAAAGGAQEPAGARGDRAGGGFATDEAAEAEAEAAARVAVAAPPPPHHSSDPAPHGSAARPLPVRRDEAGAGSFYGRLQEDGLLRIVQAFE
ncbi:hypothetical protein Rsub_00137 [Raphidocelis subcapitata]|uniref:1-alkyl-2-acetylglycerophosphocholine esterase n=1 Tax=Raphidocelis subcapitata TaxID=307507 RepID=A0A2V0NJM3_9CHLO|nr:hypothetical protein Rsub_00137 [Raphidocelis subcapitata]|eukprot:GBF87426.1 hypothetical protein Rsub_00137 [Raphidocelis subcapitata]